jgi:hypothetical protein
LFGLRITIAAVGTLSFVLLVDAQTAAPSPVEFPAWLAAFPGAHDERRTAAYTEISSTYRVSRSPSDVTAHYREQFKKAEIHFNVSFDGIGTVIRCSEGKEYCVIQIREIDDGTSVKASYSPSAGASISVVAASDSTPETPVPVSSPSAPTKSDQAAPPSTHQVEYIIEGTAGAAGLTYRNAGGGTEQNDVALPAHVSFRTVTGAFLYISAQKKGPGGTVRVEIKVDGILYAAVDRVGTLRHRVGKWQGRRSEDHLLSRKPGLAVAPHLRRQQFLQPLL